MHFGLRCCVALAISFPTHESSGVQKGQNPAAKGIQRWNLNCLLCMLFPYVSPLHLFKCPYQGAPSGGGHGQIRRKFPTELKKSLRRAIDVCVTAACLHEMKWSTDVLHLARDSHVSSGQLITRGFLIAVIALENLQ